MVKSDIRSTRYVAHAVLRGSGPPKDFCEVSLRGAALGLMAFTLQSMYRALAVTDEVSSSDI